MRLRGTVGVIGVGCLALLGCASGNRSTVSAPAGSTRATSAHAASARAAGTYVVQAHDTLYSIAWRHDLDYRDLARWNRIGPDYRIAVGQVLLLGPPGAASSGASVVRAAPVRPAPEKPPAPSIGWVWPTLSSSAPRPVPGGGILLFGALGQPVRAAAAGRVVYVGNGLRAYGNLVIIKHGENWLSAYAHLDEPLVREGQDVRSAERIAGMGEGSHRTAALYFEIRLDGKPVDPLTYLPAMK